MSLIIRSSRIRYKGVAPPACRVIRRSVAIDRINPAELGRPSGFSHVVSVTASRLAFLAGQTALDDYRGHARQIGEVWRRLVGREYPAMAAVGVHRLWDPAALVELQGIAVTR